MITLGTQILMALAAVLVIMGATWDSAKPTVLKFTRTGYIATILIILSTALGVYDKSSSMREEARYRELIESYRDQLKMLKNRAEVSQRIISQTNEKIDSLSDEEAARSSIITLSHIEISIPRVLFRVRENDTDSSGLVVYDLEPSGSRLLVADLGIVSSRVRLKFWGAGEDMKRHAAILEHSEGKYLVLLCTTGYRFIFHPIELEVNKCEVYSTSVHLSIAIQKPFEMKVNENGVEPYMPKVSVGMHVDFIDTYDSDSTRFFVKGCPYFLILNRAYQRRFVLAEAFVEDGVFRLRYK